MVPWQGPFSCRCHFQGPVFPGSEEPDPQISLLRASLASDPLFDDFLSCAKTDANYRKLIQCLTDDTKFPHDLNLYQCVRNELSLYREDNHCLVIYSASRVVVPQPLRRRVLDSLHVSHCGEVKTYEVHLGEPVIINFIQRFSTIPRSGLWSVRTSKCSIPRR